MLSAIYFFSGKLSTDDVANTILINMNVVSLVAC